MNFFTNNSYYIFRSFFTQIGMAVFGLILFFATNTYNPELMLFSSILAIFLYASLIYVTIWDVGAHDRIRCDSGRVEKTPFKGFFISLCANSLNLLLIFLLFLGGILKTPFDSFTVLYVIAYYALVLFQGAFTGTVIYVAKLCTNIGEISGLSQTHPIPLWMLVGMFILSVAVMLFVSEFAYYMGFKQKRIFPQGQKKE